MSDLATIDQSQQRAPAKSSRKPTITPRIKRALHLMVWDNKTDNEAAVETGMTITNLRLAMREPHVRSYYRDQLQVLRERESSRNIHRLVQIRDAADNMPAIQAIRLLEQTADEDGSRNPGASHSSGVTIRIINQAPAAPPMIDVSPTDRHTTDTRERIDE